jgi:hypothetical protein
MADQLGHRMINMLFISQDTIGAEGRMQEALQSCRLVVIGDSKKRRNFLTVD